MFALFQANPIHQSGTFLDTKSKPSKASLLFLFTSHLQVFHCSIRINYGRSHQVKHIFFIQATLAQFKVLLCQVLLIRGKQVKTANNRHNLAQFRPKFMVLIFEDSIFLRNETPQITRETFSVS